MTSLSELKSIHQQRIADEREAFERERVQRIEAARAAEQAKIEAAEARARAEREEVLRIEQARADAEREARMKVEAAEAAERARLQLALEQQRHADELELRRAEVAKKRPKWMIAVTALAVVGGLGFAALAVQHGHEADEATQQAKAAQERRDQAIAQAELSRKELVRIQGQLDELDVKIQAAVDAVMKAQTTADRDHAKQLAAAAEQARIDAKRALAIAQAKHDKDVRDAGLDYSKCANSGALGCLDDTKPKKK